MTTATIPDEPTRRDVLFIATGAVAAVGAAAVVWPLVSQMNPDASTVAAGFPLEVDLAPMAVGQVIKVFWRGQPIFISHRTPKEIEAAQTADWKSFRDPQPDSERVKAGREQWLVVSAICTHLGCIPSEHIRDMLTTAGSASAMARNMTLPAARGSGRHRAIFR